MKAIVTNQLTVIKDPTPEVKAHLQKLLSYRDKSAEYKLKKWANNPFMKASDQYKEAERNSRGSMLYHLKDGHLAVSSSFFYLFKDLINDIDDRRVENGQTVPLPWKDKPHDLREYQKEAVDIIEKEPRGILNFATGLGKTLTAVHLIKNIRKRTLVVVPTESVALQFYEVLASAFGDSKVALFKGNRKKIKDITVGVAASVNNQVEKFKEHDLGMIIFDEVHHIAANTFFNISKALADTYRIYGLTATDFRSDGKDIMINAGCGPVIMKRDIKWGVENGWLAKPIFLVREIDTTHRNDKGSDKLRNYKEHVINCKETKAVIEQDAQLAMDRGNSVLILVNEVAHGEELSKNLGIPFATGNDKDSQKYVDQLNKGEIPGLIGTDGKIGEGSDTKNVDVLILANFVASKGPVIQAVGRGLRITDKKNTCMILDYILTGSAMLKRHAKQRISYYQEISENVGLV